MMGILSFLLDTSVGGRPLIFWLSWFWALPGLALTIWVILQRRSPVSTLAWIMALNLVPLLGLVIYAYFGPHRIRRQRLRRWHERASLMSEADLATLRAHLPPPPTWAQRHSQLIEAACGLPACSASHLQVLPGGKAKLDMLLLHIAQAQANIHLEYYIFEPDQSGQAVLQALTRSAARGVGVRLLVDAVGSARLLSRRGRPLLQPLRDAGGKVAVFHPTRLDRLRPLVNLRTHRKLAIIDGRIGLLGGINVSDVENARYSTRPWRDTHLLMRGSAVRWLQYIFLRDWLYADGEQPGQDLLPPAEPVGSTPVQIIASGPDSDGEAIHRAMIDVLGRARQRVLLATPYFVPTEAAWTALTNAALRGVRTQLMVPAQNDIPIVGAAARSYYRELQEAGVLIYEYEGRMFHAKTLVIDDDYAMLGSANFDNRSFRLNFEVAVAIFDHQITSELARMFRQDMAHCTLVPIRRHALLHHRLFEAVARLASPLL